MDSQHTGMVRVKIHRDKTATCTLDLKVDGRVVYTVAIDTDRLISDIGHSRVCDVTDTIRWLLGEVFGWLTQEMQDHGDLTDWVYHQIYGRPMRSTKHSAVPRLIPDTHRTDATRCP